MAEPAGDTPAGRAAAAEGFELLPHGADIGIRAYGPSLAETFAQAGLALTRIVTDQPVAAREAVAIEAQAPAPDLLLIDWLNAIIFEMSVRGMLFGRYEVELDGDRLRGRAWGEPVETARHAPAVEAKGATYTGLRLERSANGQWTAECIVDV